MNKISTLSLLTLTLCATPGFATEPPAFTGLTLGASAGLSRNSVDYSGYIAGKSSSKSNFVGNLNAAYGFALNESVVLSVGATYALNNTKFGQVSYLESGNTIYVTGELKDHWSVFVAPGLRFAPQWLGYAKLAYHSAKSDYTDTLMGSSTSRHHGVGYGAGVAYAVARNVEVNAEIQHVRLSSASFALSSGKPAVTEFNVGVNYRF